MTSPHGFTAPVHVRWSDIDMYQHINHATMVTILEEARIPFLLEPFGEQITTIGLLIAEVNIAYKAQLRLVDSPLQVDDVVEAGQGGRLHGGLRGALGRVRRRIPGRRSSPTRSWRRCTSRSNGCNGFQTVQREYLQRWTR